MDRDYQVRYGIELLLGWRQFVIPEPVIIGNTMYILALPPKPICIEPPSERTEWPSA